MWLYSQNFSFIRTIRTSVFFAVRFTLSQSSPPVKNATHLRTVPFVFQILFMSFERFLSTSMFFCSSMYIEPVLTFREECNESTDLLFWRLSLCLSRDSLSCDTHSWDLFLYLWYVPPHSCAFHTFCFRPIFSYVYYHLKYFCYPWWFFWLAKARNLIFIFNFSSQRPQLNYTWLSYVYSFDTMEFSIKQKC